MAADAGVGWWMQRDALSRRSGHSRASRMALIRYFLLPSNAVNGVSTLNSLPFSIPAGPKDTWRRHIHTINTYGFFIPLTAQPTGFLAPWQRLLWCKSSSRQNLAWPAFVAAVASLPASCAGHPTSFSSSFLLLTSHTCHSISTPHYESDGSLLRPIRLSEAAASLPARGRPSLQRVLEEAKGRRAEEKWAWKQQIYRRRC